MKATYGEVNGEPRELFKDPVTDDGTKKSLKGLIRVVSDEGRIVALDGQKHEGDSLLTLLFEDGVFYKSPSIAEIRQRLGV